ncbi:hypothetical protein JZ751_021804 [Albula glossodonta]|uniref:Molecule interacting with CasL protein 1 n=1 Tax=Albula glossodonta TaxID=121402 RepID=A0A8T2MZL7_9TELE|nr:hypothetical protein JZ751_021804 [Albula glossodonta]
MAMAPHDPPSASHALFDSFVHAQSCKDVLQYFSQLCCHLEVDPRDYKCFYVKLKERLNYWKAKALWAKLDKRATHIDYQQGKACTNNKCLVLGAGPCGLRTAIELAFLGAQVVLLEKRDAFSRNNVLHLWPFTIHDLRGLGAKKLYGKFCSGSLDHISIRQLQLILLKVALLLGVEVHTGVEYRGLLEPQRHATGVTGWRADVLPQSHPSSCFQFDVFISAGGGRFVPEGFRRKELRGKLAIGITANFINRHTAAETQVPEISGVARIYNQKFFQNLLTETGIDLENIVYYKDDTHYFVMTAKKKSLLNKGVIKQDYSDAERLLSPANVHQEALQRYAQDAAHFSTQHRLPALQFALNHAGHPDVAMFDFTCMYRAENASYLRERCGQKLLIGLVGDCLVEPFWPLGTGVARGFLAAFDAAWMVRRWGLGVPHLELIAERESIYQLLSQTTPENTSKNYSLYSIDPTTRYPNLNLNSIRANQVQHLCDAETQVDSSRLSRKQKVGVPHLRQDSVGRCEDLLSWCQRHTAGYERVKVKDLTSSWRSGLALCALIHHFNPALIDYSSLHEADSTYNNQLAFDIAERELGIPPIMSGSDMAAQSQPDKLAMVLYLTQFYNVFSQRTPPAEPDPPYATSRPVSLSSTRSVISFLSKLKHNSLQRRKTGSPPVSPPVSPMPAPGSSEVCYFCGQRVYVLERIGTEGRFFHRSCFSCHQCGATLRLGSYSFSQQTGRFSCAQHSEEPELLAPLSPSAPQNQPQIAGSPRVCQSMETNETAANSTEDNDVEANSTKISSSVANGKDAIGTLANSTKAKDIKAQSSKANGVLVPEQDQSPSPPQPSQEKVLEGEHSETDCISTGEQGADRSPEPRPIPAMRSTHIAFRVRVESCDDLPAGPPPIPKPRTLPPKTIAGTQLPPSVGTEIQSREEVRGKQVQSDGKEDSLQNSRPKQALRKLQLSAEEKSQLVNLSFSHDSESEPSSFSSAPEPMAAIASSSSASSSPSSTAAIAPPKPARTLLLPESEEGAGPFGDAVSGNIREQRHRLSFRRKEEPEGHTPHRPRSKFSPWNLSSPRLGRDHRVAGTATHLDRTGASAPPDGNLSEETADDEDDDDDDDDEDVFGCDDVMDLFDEKFHTVPTDPVEAQKLQLMKMRTLERRAKLCEMQRFHKAQTIQRRLEEIEVTFKELEEKGVVLERALRGEAASSGSSGMIDQWIQLVHQKNALVSEESDLMVASRQLELEDKQSMLEMELRKYMELDDSEKSPEQHKDEERVLQEMLEVVDMRNSLVSFLEEKRLKELNEQLHCVSLLEPKRQEPGVGQVHWG